MGQSICAGNRDEGCKNLNMREMFTKKDIYVKKTHHSPLLKRRIRRCEERLEAARDDYKSYKDDRALNIVCATNTCSSKRSRWGRKSKLPHR